MSAIQGYSNQKKIGGSQYNTIQPLGSDKFGMDISTKLAFDIGNGTPFAIVSSSQNEQNPQILDIEITGHGARFGDVIRFDDAPNTAIELSVLEVVDANNLKVAFTGGIQVPAPADEVTILRFITARADEAGSITLGPTQFNYDGSTIAVEEDTADASNNRPLPSGLFFRRNGEYVNVAKDTGTPSNTVPLPIEIVSASGTEINITAGDINVQVTDMGVNFDSLRIGDGSGNYMAINASAEATVRDGDANTALGAIDDAAVTNPTLDASIIAALKGILTADNAIDTAQGAIDDAAVTNPANDASVIAALKGILTADNAINTAQGAIDDAAVTNPALDASVISALKGILTADNAIDTAQGAIDDAAVTNPANDASVIAALKGILTADNAIDTAQGAIDDAAVTDPALDASVIAALKGILTADNAIDTAQGAIDDAAVTDPSLDASVIAALKGILTAANAISDSNEGTGTVSTSQITVGTSAVRATVSGAAPSAGRKKLIIKPSKNNTGAIYCGSSSVTTANGVEIIGPDTRIFDFDSSDYYLISNTAGQTVELLEVN